MRLGNLRIWPVTTARDLLGESPVWDEARAQLLRVDILNHAVHWWDPASGNTTTLGVTGEVSAAIPSSRGGMLLAAGHEIFVLDGRGARETLAIVEDNQPDNRFNDCQCDPAGRLWAGTMSKSRKPGAAALYQLSPGKPIQRVVAATTLSNGIAWSPGAERMYFIDSVTQRIDVFDFDNSAGAISGRRPFAFIEPRAGLPDGMAVDAAGGVWVCLFGGAAIRRYGEDGVLDEVIRLPVTNPTCPAFGGPGLKTLYVTSARHRLSREQLAAEPLAGAVLALSPGVSGLPANRFAG
jgi:sugar lactone lactonase YvrE